MLKLEAMNPTEAPARSWMLNGVWEFLYTGGLTPGTVAVQVDRAFQRNLLGTRCEVLFYLFFYIYICLFVYSASIHNI